MADAIAKPGYLIVDDDPTFAAVLARALQRRGCKTFTAADESEALALLQTHAHDIRRIVLDLQLQQSSGLQLIPRIKQMDATIEVVILTGYSSIATAVEAIKLGAHHYLCKPADADEIIAAFEPGARAAGSAENTEQSPSVKRLEWEHIQFVLAQHDGNISAAARSLGMHRRTLQRKLRKRPVRH